MNLLKLLLHILYFEKMLLLQDKIGINKLCSTRVTHNSLRLRNQLPSDSQWGWNLEMVFVEGGNPENLEKQCVGHVKIYTSKAKINII